MHFIKRCQRLKAIKLTVAWSLNCFYVIVCAALRCREELTKDLTIKAKDQGQHHWIAVLLDIDFV